MIPILSNTATLTGNGLGRLAEALSCIVTHEVNGEYELRMTYPVTGIRYGDLAENLIIWAEPDNLTTAQAFRIYRITRPLNGIVTIYARHIAYDMSGIVVKPFTASTLTTALSSIAPNCSPSCPFTLTSTRTVATQMKVTVPTVLWGLLGGQSGSFLDIYGGEWDFNNYTAELKTTLGTDRGVTVRYGKNLTKLEQDVTIEATYAGVFPFWYDEESGVLVKLTGDYISIPGATGSRLLLLDFSDEWETAPTEVQLQARANAYITANDPGTPKISWKVNMAMLSQSEEFANLAILEQVMLGDTIHVYYEPMNLTASARAVKLEYDVLLERYTTVTLGRVKQNMAQIVAAEKKETAQAFKSMKSTLEKAIDSATDFITNPSGEMRFIYDANDVLQEIVVLDNPDISQAQSVWRLNSGGYGHSSTGYAGPYTLAITQNGAIVADFITAGTMAGNRIRTGLLEDETSTNYWNLDTGEFHLEALSTFGGRNLLLKSATKHISPYSSATMTFTDGVTVADWGASDAITCSGTKGGDNVFGTLGGTSASSQSSINGKKYVHSIYIKNNDTVDLDVTDNGIGAYVTVAPGESKRVVMMGTGNGSNYVQFSFRTASTFNFTYWHPQIEYGEVATDWNPAPEDKVGNDEIISKINVSTEGVVIQAAKVNLAGYVTFTNLSTSGQTTINGANITTGTIDASQVTVSNINAGNITTGTITDANGYNSWNLTTGAFSITNGSINISTSTETYDVIKLNSGNFSNDMRASGVVASYTAFGVTTSTAYTATGINLTSGGNLKFSVGLTGAATLSDSLEITGTSLQSTINTTSVTVRDKTNTQRLAKISYDTLNQTGQLTFTTGTGGIDTLLTHDGLTFYNSSGTVTAFYDADNANMIKTYTGTAQNVSSSTSVLTEVASISLTPGVYDIVATANFAAASAGYRRSVIATTSGGGSAITWTGFVTTAPAVGYPTYHQIHTHYRVTTNTTLYLNIQQNSGSTLSCNGYMSCLRIA